MSDAENDFYPFANQQNWLNFKADQENLSNFKAEVERLNVELDENMGLLESWPIRDVLERIVRESRGKDVVIERLRELLKECQPYIAGWPEGRKLFSEIQKEVSDE